MKIAFLFLFLFLLLVVSFATPAVDVRQIEMRRLFQPTANELDAEHAGRVYIYEGLRSTDIARAMDEQFDRIERMMFIRTKVVDETGEAAKDAQTGADLVEDDGC